MIIELTNIPPEGRSLEGTEPEGLLDLCGDREPRPAGPVHYSVKAFLVGSEFFVRGTLEVDVEFVCSRCAKRFAAHVREPDFTCSRDVKAVTLPAPPAGRNRARHAREALRSVDLTEETREAILVAFPSYPLCRSNCKGLCAQCGADLNKGPCDCAPPSDCRWDALSQLALKKGTTDGRSKKKEIEEPGG